MASIHKDPRGKSPYWYVAFTLPDGRRTFRSTKQKDRKLALDVARSLEKTNQKARSGQLSEVAMRKLFGDLLEGLGAVPMRQSETVRSFSLSWLEGKQLSVKPNVYKLYKKSIARFLEVLAERADKPLADVRVSDIAAFRDHRLTIDRVAIGTLLLDMRTVRSAFGYAARQGLISHNPAQVVELPANRPLERVVFSPEEIRSLLSAAGVEWRTLILAGYYLGARLSDAKSLRWDCVDLAGGWIRYVQGETNREVTVPIHPDLEAQLLAIAHNDNPHGYLCPGLALRRTDGQGGLSAEFVRLMEKAGIDRQVVQAAKNQFSQKSFHSLRHSFSSALANAGVAAELRMKLAGHKSVEVHRRYTHLELEPLRLAIAALPSLEPLQSS